MSSTNNHLVQNESGPEELLVKDSGHATTHHDVHVTQSPPAAGHQLSVPSKESWTTIGAELATKQRIIDTYSLHLQLCMKEKSELQIQNDVCKSQLNHHRIEVEKLQKTSQWYKTQLYNTQKELRERTVTQEADRRHAKAEQERLNIQLLKSLSECEILNERLQLEQSRRCDHDLDESSGSLRLSKDSGIFSESNNSDTCSEVVEVFSSLDPHPSSSHSKELSDLREEFNSLTTLHQQLTLDRDKLSADRAMWQEKCKYQETLLSVQQKSLDQLQEELQSANKTSQAKRQEHKVAVNYLAKCRQQLDQLMKENGDIHRESMQMILKFERVSSILTDYRREIRDKNEEIRLLTLLPKSVATDSGSQTKGTVCCDKGMQTTAEEGPVSPSTTSGILTNTCPTPPMSPQQTSNYYKNLLTVVEREYQQKLLQREVNTRTLMKKLREAMRHAKDHEQRHQKLTADIHRVMQQVLPSSTELSSEEEDEGLNVDEMLQKLLTIIPQCRESSQSVSTECKSCDSTKEASDRTRQENERLRSQQVERIAQVDALEAELDSKSRCAEQYLKTIELLELEQQSLHSSLDLLKRKFLGMEKQVLEHAQFKDTAESERVQRHQLMLLLMQIKNERDEMMCQNEGMNKLLREMIQMDGKKNPSRTIMARARETLQRSANYQTTELWRPISEEIHSMQQEMKTLNSAVLWRTRGEISLLDELQGAINY